MRGVSDFDLAGWLQRRLQAEGMTPSELGRVAGLHRSTINKILSGERQGQSWETIARLAQAFHLTRAQLVAEVDREPLPPDHQRTEQAIMRDGNLTPSQRRALVDHYRTYRFPEQRAPVRRGRPPRE